MKKADLMQGILNAVNSSVPAAAMFGWCQSQAMKGDKDAVKIVRAIAKNIEQGAEWLEEIGVKP